MVELRRILDKAESGAERDPLFPREAGEIGVEESSGDLADPISAKIGDQQTIAVTHAGVTGDCGWRDEFIGLIAGIGGLDRLHRIIGVLARAADDRPISFLDPVPALIAIHRVVAAAERGNAQIAETGNVFLKLLHIGTGCLGRCVTPVEKGVDGDRHPGFGQNAGQSGDLALVRMNPAGRHQPHQVGGPAACLQFAYEIAQ